MKPSKIEIMRQNKEQRIGQSNERPYASRAVHGSVKNLPKSKAKARSSLEHTQIDTHTHAHICEQLEEGRQLHLEGSQGVIFSGESVLHF